MSVPTQGGIKRNIAIQITANETTEVTAIVNNLKSDSVVVVSPNTLQGSTAGGGYISTKTPATGVIGLTSQAGDTSVYDIVIFN